MDGLLGTPDGRTPDHAPWPPLTFLSQLRIGARRAARTMVGKRSRTWCGLLRQVNTMKGITIPYLSWALPIVQHSTSGMASTGVNEWMALAQAASDWKAGRLKLPDADDAGFIPLADDPSRRRRRYRDRSKATAIWVIKNRRAPATGCTPRKRANSERNGWQTMRYRPVENGSGKAKTLHAVVWATASRMAIRPDGYWLDGATIFLPVGAISASHP